MADFGSALEMVNDLIARLERLTDASDIGVVVLRLDFLHRMLVSLDIEDDVVDMIGTLNENFSVLERSSSHANCKVFLQFNSIEKNTTLSLIALSYNSPKWRLFCSLKTRLT